MRLEAPYKGRDDAPEESDKATADSADKPEAEVEETVLSLEADKRTRPADDEPETEVTEEIEVADEEEAESTEVPDAAGILRHADYTRKTQELARQREQFTREKAEQDQRVALYEGIDSVLSNNPALAKTHTVEQLVAMVQSPEAPARNSSIPPEARRELDAMRKEIAETKDALFVDRVESAVKRVAKQYGLKQPQVEQLVKFAVEDDLIVPGLPVEKINRRLTMLARGMTYGRAEAKGQTKMVKQLKEKARAASGGTSATSSTSEATRPRTRGWDKLIAQYTK